jgi:hypothetical protein
VDDHGLNSLADDVHLITAPVRIAANWIKILLLIAVLPFVFVVSLVNWLLTGTPLMSADEILSSKVLLTVLSPSRRSSILAAQERARISAFNSGSRGVYHHPYPCSRVREV